MEALHASPELDLKPERFEISLPTKEAQTWVVEPSGENKYRIVGGSKIQRLRAESDESVTMVFTGWGEKAKDLKLPPALAGSKEVKMAGKLRQEGWSRSLQVGLVNFDFSGEGYGSIKAPSLEAITDAFTEGEIEIGTIPIQDLRSL